MGQMAHPIHERHAPRKRELGFFLLPHGRLRSTVLKQLARVAQPCARSRASELLQDHQGQLVSSMHRLGLDFSIRPPIHLCKPLTRRHTFSSGAGGPLTKRPAVVLGDDHDHRMVAQRQGTGPAFKIGLMHITPRIFRQDCDSGHIGSRRRRPLRRKPSSPPGDGPGCTRGRRPGIRVASSPLATPAR